jgi:serine/threonine protein kinase
VGETSFRLRGTSGSLEADSEVFIVMALLEGLGLGSYVTNGSLRTPQKLELAAQVADGLSAAHRCGVIHLDVKPSNVIVTSNGRPVLIDCGIASSPDAGHRQRNGKWALSRER